MILKHGLNPLLVIYLILVLNKFIIVSSFVSFIGVDKIAFAVQSYRMNLEKFHANASDG